MINKKFLHENHNYYMSPIAGLRINFIIMDKPMQSEEHQKNNRRKTLVEELNEMEKESPVKRLMEEFPALKYQEIDRGKILALEVEEE